MGEEISCLLKLLLKVLLVERASWVYVVSSYYPSSIDILCILTLHPWCSVACGKSQNAKSLLTWAPPFFIFLLELL